MTSTRLERWIWLVAAATAMAVASCSSDSGPKPTELKEFKPRANAKVAWRASVGDSGPYVFTPAIWDGDVFAAGTDSAIARFDARNGKQKWRVDAKSPVSGGTEAFSGLVTVGTSKGMVLAYTADGKPKWTSQVSSEVLSPPAFDDGVVVVRTSDGHIHGLDAADGTRRWEYVGTLPALLIRTPAGVAISKGSVFAGMPGGKLIALSLSTGTLLWESAVSQPRGDTELERVTDVVSTPVVADGQVCAIAFQGRIGCFDALRGALVWARDASGTGGLGADGRYFYYVDEASNLHAVDRDTGASIWKQDILAHRSLGSPGVIGRYIVVGDFEGYLHFFDREDGALVTRLATDGGPISSAPLYVGEGNLIVQTREGSLFAVTVR